MALNMQQKPSAANAFSRGVSFHQPGTDFFAFTRSVRVMFNFYFPNADVVIPVLFIERPSFLHALPCHKRCVHSGNGAFSGLGSLLDHLPALALYRVVSLPSLAL